MKKSVFLVTHIHEAGVQAGHQLPDAPQINVAHGEGEVRPFFLQFHQALVFEQGDGDFFGLYVYNEFVCHNRFALIVF